MIEASRAWFLIGSPTHYINALELLHSGLVHFNEKYLIVISGFVEGIATIDSRLGTKNEWNNSYIYNLRTESNASDLKYWKLQMSYLEDVLVPNTNDYIVIGNLGSALFYAWAQKNRKLSKKFIILDDGTPSINLLQARSANTDYKLQHLSFFKHQLKISSGFGVFLPFRRTLKKLTFFTMFNLKGRKDDVIWQNSYTFLSQNCKSRKKEHEAVYLIGQQVVDKRLILAGHYLNAIKFLKAHYELEGRKIFYIFHRAEGKEIRNKIGNLTETLSFDTPLEFAFSQNPLPGQMVGFFSSAMFTLSRIYKGELSITCARFPYELIQSGYQESAADIKNIYKAAEMDPYITMLEMNKEVLVSGTS